MTFFILKNIGCEKFTELKWRNYSRWRIPEIWRENQEHGGGFYVGPDFNKGDEVQGSQNRGKHFFQLNLKIQIISLNILY